MLDCFPACHPCIGCLCMCSESTCTWIQGKAQKHSIATKATPSQVEICLKRGFLCVCLWKRQYPLCWAGPRSVHHFISMRLMETVVFRWLLTNKVLMSKILTITIIKSWEYIKHTLASISNSGAKFWQGPHQGA